MERLGLIVSLVVLPWIAVGGVTESAAAAAGEECVGEQSACDSTSNPPANPFRVRFFNHQFPADGDSYYLGEEFKNLLLAPEQRVLFSTGGEYRFRFLNEANRLRGGGPGRSTYQQTRFRLYGDLRVGDVGRLYVEGIDAATFQEDLPFQAIDENRWDVLNAFFDLELFGNGRGDGATLRVGRQELLYGSQRFVTPLDWSNTRRNFEGISLITRLGNWKFDLFSVRPVNTPNGNRPRNFNRRFDTPDQSRTFQGAYLTFAGFPEQTIDLYWLWLHEQTPRDVVPDGDRHTLGARWVLKRPTGAGELSAEVEGAYQFGRDNGLGDATLQQIRAGMVSVTLDHTWNEQFLSPQIGGLFYWSSGDRAANDGQMNTFGVMFPLGHSYWGIIDNLSGQNLINYGLLASVKPHRSLTFSVVGHLFHRSRTGDAIQSVGTTAFGPRGGSRNIGTEVDIIATFDWNSQFRVQAGYSWFFYGRAVTANPALARPDATQFYVFSQLRF